MSQKPFHYHALEFCPQIRRITLWIQSSYCYCLWLVSFEIWYRLHDGSELAEGILTQLQSQPTARLDGIILMIYNVLLYKEYVVASFPAPQTQTLKDDNLACLIPLCIAVLNILVAPVCSPEVSAFALHIIKKNREPLPGRPDLVLASSGIRWPCPHSLFRNNNFLVKWLFCPSGVIRSDSGFLPPIEKTPTSPCMCEE